MSPVGRTTVAMPSSSRRSTKALGSAKLSSGSRRTVTRVPDAASAPSHTASRSGVNALHRVSTIPGVDTALSVVTEPLQLRRRPDLRPLVERAGRDHFGADADAEAVLQPGLDRDRDRVELRCVTVARDRHDELVAVVDA